MSDQTVATPDAGTNGTVTVKRPHERFVEYLARRAQVDSEGRAFSVAANQIDKLVTAETAEELWDADEGGVFSGQDMVDVEIEIKAIGFGKSSDEYDAELGVFVSMECTRLDTGEDIIVNCGSPLVITKIRMFEQRDLLPIQGVLKATKTQKGALLKLRPLPVRAVRGTTAE
jgi:hypothetical protein